MVNYYKFGVTSIELNKVRKYLIQDIKDNNTIKHPKLTIHNMTLRMYFDIIKECMISAADENGVVKDAFGNTWYSEFRNIDVRIQDPIEVAKSWMDGRGLFTEHFNTQLRCGEKHYGNWDNIESNDQNQWYHEDRLDDPLWFKECINVIGHSGHPTEMLTCGNFNPVEVKENEWVLVFDTFSRNNYYTLKGYLHFKRLNYPIFINCYETYLTPKQLKELCTHI